MNGLRIAENADCGRVPITLFLRLIFFHLGVRCLKVMVNLKQVHLS